MVWYSQDLRIFQFVVTYTVKDLAYKVEIVVFLEFFCIFYDPTDIGNFILGSSAFSKSSLNIWNFMVHVLLKPGLENFEHYFASMWDESNCALNTYTVCSTHIQSAETRPGTDCGSDHEFITAKIRHKLKKVGKTNRPFRHVWPKSNLLWLYHGSD